jgi:hypothetical protein
VVGHPATDGAYAGDRDGAAFGQPDANFGFHVPDGAPSAPPPAPSRCVNLQCRQQTCPGGGTTSLSGTVYAPNGTLPLYNVAVYIPNAPLDPLPKGMSCDRCGTLASGHPIASALSDAQGRFRIDNVPVGKDVPLVVQVGKWRRQVTLPEVLPCQDNPLTDPQMTRLPRNRQEGDLPRVAVTTGQCDPLSCTIAKLGVDRAELGVSGQDTAFTFFNGNSPELGPPGMHPARELWNDYNELSKYDMAAFSCMCEEMVNTPAPQDRDKTAFETVTRYLDSGGRAFGTDYEYIWMKYSPDRRLAGAFHIGAPPNGKDADGSPIVLDTTFPKGKALADWLHLVNPGQPYGRVPADIIFSNLAGMPADGQVWGRSRTDPPVTVQPRFVTINTPVAAPADQQCGRLVHLDAHVVDVAVRPPPVRPGAPRPTNPAPPPPPPFPELCGTTLSDGEAVMVFFLFDLAACIQEDTRPPTPPPPVIL